MRNKTNILVVIRAAVMIALFVVSVACDSGSNIDNEPVGTDTDNSDTVTENRGDSSSEELEECVEGQDNCDSDECTGDDCDSEECTDAICAGDVVTAPEGIDPFDTLVVGDNTCYMIRAYFPKDIVEEILPERFTIPDDATMTANYPDTVVREDEHPFMLSFCHGANIHDVLTNMAVPDQEELMFLFPAMYEHDNGEKHLVSFIPVLYLDSEAGVQGGLLFGLRKEYHPEMQKDEVSSVSGWWAIEEIIEASFDTIADGEMPQLDNFFEQTFKNPFATVSYPSPQSQRVFYKAEVFPNTVIKAREEFFWNYRGTTITDSAKTDSVFAEYYFTMTWPMDGKTYFE